MPQTPDVLSDLTVIQTLLYAILLILLMLVAIGATWTVLTWRQLKVRLR
jgi:cell division protein FtsL